MHRRRICVHRCESVAIPSSQVVRKSSAALGFLSSVSSVISCSIRMCLFPDPAVLSVGSYSRQKHLGQKNDSIRDGTSHLSAPDFSALLFNSFPVFQVHRMRAGVRANHFTSPPLPPLRRGGKGLGHALLDQEPFAPLFLPVSFRLPFAPSRL